MGQQPGLPGMLVPNNSTGQDGANTRRERLRRPHRRTLPMLQPLLRSVRAIPTIQRCLAFVADAKGAVRRVGQLLQHALPCRGRSRALGVERRGPCLDRSLLGPPKEMGARGRLRRGMGQPPTLLGRMGQENVLRRGILDRWRHRRDPTIRPKERICPRPHSMLRRCHALHYAGDQEYPTGQHEQGRPLPSGKGRCSRREGTPQLCHFVHYAGCYGAGSWFHPAKRAQHGPTGPTSACFFLRGHQDPGRNAGPTERKRRVGGSTRREWPENATIPAPTRPICSTTVLIEFRRFWRFEQYHAPPPMLPTRTRRGEPLGSASCYTPYPSVLAAPTNGGSGIRRGKLIIHLIFHHGRSTIFSTRQHFLSTLGARHRHIRIRASFCNNSIIPSADWFHGWRIGHLARHWFHGEVLNTGE